jgi:hypothetical protein
VCGCVGVRVCGCVGVRVCGCASVWVCECVGVRVCGCASVLVCECVEWVRVRLCACFGARGVALGGGGGGDQVHERLSGELMVLEGPLGDLCGLAFLVGTCVWSRPLASYVVATTRMLSRPGRTERPGRK